MGEQTTTVALVVLAACNVAEAVAQAHAAWPVLIVAAAVLAWVLLERRARAR
jgi:hypothetical protein